MIRITAEYQAELLQRGWLTTNEVAAMMGCKSASTANHRAAKDYANGIPGVLRVLPGSAYVRVAGQLQRNFCHGGAYVYRPDVAERYAAEYRASQARRAEREQIQPKPLPGLGNWQLVSEVRHSLAGPISQDSLITWLKGLDLPVTVLRKRSYNDGRMAAWELHQDVALRLAAASQRVTNYTRGWWRGIDVEKLLRDPPATAEPTETGELCDVRDEPVEPDTTLRDEAVEVLRRMLRDDDSIVRCLAAWAVLTTGAL